LLDGRDDLQQPLADRVLDRSLEAERELRLEIQARLVADMEEVDAGAEVPGEGDGVANGGLRCLAEIVRDENALQSDHDQTLLRDEGQASCRALPGRSPPKTW